jgi:hypothetical protein
LENNNPLYNKNLDKFNERLKLGRIVNLIINQEREIKESINQRGEVKKISKGSLSSNPNKPSQKLNEKSQKQEHSNANKKKIEDTKSILIEDNANEEREKERINLLKEGYTEETIKLEQSKINFQ